MTESKQKTISIYLLAKATFAKATFAKATFAKATFAKATLMAIL